MAEEREISVRLSLPRSDPIEITMDVGEGFSNPLPVINKSLEETRKNVDSVVEPLKEARKTLETMLELVQLLREYRSDIKNVTNLVGTLRDSRKDFEGILGLAKSFGVSRPSQRKGKKKSKKKKEE